MTNLFKCLISTLMLFAAYAHATVRVLPCDTLGCSDSARVKQTVLEATKDLPEGNHTVYVHNIETEDTMYYVVLGQNVVSGPFPAAPKTVKYIGNVYQAERDFFNQFGVIPPGAQTTFVSYLGYYLGHFPASTLWVSSPLPLTIPNFATIGGQTMDFNLVASRLDGVITAYLANMLTLQVGHQADIWDVMQYIHSRLVQLQMTNRHASNWQFSSSVSGRIPLISSAQMGSTAADQAGMSLQFSTSVLPPTMNIIFDDAMITAVYDPKTGRWNLAKLVDAEGQIIYFQDNKLQFKGTYRVTDKNQALYQMIFRIMRMYNLINRAQFLRMTRVGSVFTCEGMGPCTPIEPNDNDENDREKK